MINYDDDNDFIRSPTSSFLDIGTFEILFCHQIRYDIIQYPGEFGVLAVFDETNVQNFELQFPCFPIF